MPTTPYPKESGHWYTPGGEPAYTVPNVSRGGLRPTRITDAKKLGLFPSVTGVGRVLAAPGLENWKIDQALLSAVTLPRKEGESVDAFMARAKEDSKQQAIKAAEVGKWVHANIQRHYQGQPPDPDAWVYVKGVTDIVRLHCGEQKWKAERTFASPLGYGGMIDLYSPDWILDYKGKEFGPEDKIRAWDENGMQLSAYRKGVDLPMARCANVFFSRNNPGVAAFIEWEEDELERCWNMFYHALEIWKYQKRYRPETK